MTQEQFEQAHEATWRAFELWLAGRQKRTMASDAQLTTQTIPAIYREVCAHLALARDRQYTSALLDRLNQLALEGHEVLYGARTGIAAKIARFFHRGFPQLVRQHGGVVLASAALYFIPLIICIVWAQFDPKAIYHVMPADEVADFQKMYSSSMATQGRDAADDVMMWGHYIGNNIKIDFQCFAGGLLFGVGTVFYLIFNGIMHGMVAGYLTQIGSGQQFWGFVSGHSSFELLGAVLAGAAGLRIGLALIAPGRLSRATALKFAAKPAVGLCGGAATMTFVAAFIEGFWSPNPWAPFEFKVGLGIGLWVLLLVYFLFAGRRHAA
ncbi:putative membrane protein SpoIIM required for sporulation [Chitinivorax tropicus]|uniref:Putative membrane protein SpoIIM required for sporulation n=1 Tax=Chitinivorax tropicus TaxID=714531 RepID=A0A840MIB8_9PROT|nr:stage II sporulation protein M [Chitinivorax tropicus]MBB5016939.1 putative membrane protein SpoIIM required for sporulation [Chitinivorax tropicus]